MAVDGESGGHAVLDIDRVQEKIESLDFGKATKKEMLMSFKLRLDSFSNDILFFNEPFTPVSITGTDCELNCKHCEKHWDQFLLGHSIHFQPNRNIF
ncbi:MAG: hypothetical protein ACT6FG_02055 [Methanosarcinaceae archaeon]